MEKTTIYFDSKTGNVARFVDKLKALCPHWKFLNINEAEHFDDKGHLITFTTGHGQVPVTTDYFMQRFSHLILSVSASGNRNWGSNFALSADRLSEKYNLPTLLKFELSGTNSEAKTFINYFKQNAMKTIIKFEKDNCMPCQEVSNYLNSLNVQYDSINAFNNPEKAIKHKVKTVPTLLVMEGDTELARVIGFKPSEIDQLVRLAKE